MEERGFEFWWQVPGEWVEEPNRRRSGWSGMVRVVLDGRMYYVKRQLNHRCYTLAHPFGWPTASREWQYLKRLQALGIGAPVGVFHGVRRTAAGVEALVVSEELYGFADLLGLESLDVAHKLVLARAVGELLGRLHREGLQHSSLYGKHVMARAQGDGFEVALIDLEKMRPRWRAGVAARRDLEQLRRHQRIFDEAQWTVLLDAHSRSFSAV